MRFALPATSLLIPLASAVSENVLSVASLSAAVRTKGAEVTSQISDRKLSVGGNRPSFLNSHRRFHALSSEANKDVPTSSTKEQRQAATEQRTCDSAFLTCMPHEKCLGCFATMQEDDVDWASVKPETPCSDVVSFLVDNGKCKDLESDQAEKDIFCSTFDNCVVWDEPTADTKDGENKGGEPALDCDSLKKCDWPGIHKGFIGDGICHDTVPGCYNHEICEFDGGDCCEDKCDASSDHVECGTDGYACRDPESKNCDPFLSTKCPDPEDDDSDEDEIIPDCGTDEALYRLVQYDSWGDGWDKTTMTVKSDADKEVYSGKLEGGAEGTQFICLSTDPACYHVQVNGGIWGNEISWEVKPVTAGAPPIADGGAPQECDFPVNGADCEKSCDGRPDKAVQNDPEYKGYMDLLSCLKDKCVIQVGACEMEKSCKPCMMDDPPGYCFVNQNYNALIDCALCHCTPEDSRPVEFCNKKSSPGSGNGQPEKQDETQKDQTGVEKQCNADQTLKGSAAVMKFATCSSVDEVAAMVTNFDENHFGALDAFESCAHSFSNDEAHGGRTALECMKVLNNTRTNPGTDKIPDAPVEAIKSLATHLYDNAESFCSCAADAQKDCPQCSSFLHFKTLLYETLDACKALDEIDCDAWSEFYDPDDPTKASCKENLVGKFEKVDFDNEVQCEFIKNGCDGVGAFPAFRKLDCGREISKPAWEFYTLYSRGCLGKDVPDNGDAPAPGAAPAEDKAKPPDSRPAPSPHEDSSKPAPVTPLAPTTPKKYVPPPDDEDNDTPASNYVPSDSAPSAPKKKRHHFFGWFVVFCFAGGAFWYHKRRSDFDFVRYRPARNWGTDSGMGMGLGAGGDGAGMYSGVNVDMGASSFEPPTLPPTPSAYEGTSA